VPAEIAGQLPLLERAAAGDREAFARLYDDQVEGVYRYLLAWTGDRSAAAELTGQVFHSALAWLPVTAGGEGEAGAWLIAMARDAVAQRRGSGWLTGPDERQAPAPDAVAAVALLGDPEREVAVLRLLCGHSLDHTAHLSGYSRRAVLQLQLAACLSVWRLTGGAGGGAGLAPPVPEPAGAPAAISSAEEFERRLGRWEIDLTGSDPALAEALAAAGALRRAIPGYVVAPGLDLVRRLRQELLVAPAPVRPAGGSGARRPAGGDGAAGTPGPADRAAVAAGAGGSRRHWVATFVAAAGIVGVLTLQLLEPPAPPPACDGRPCPAPTTVAAAGGGGLGIPLTTLGRPSSTGTTAAAPAPVPTAPRASAATAPPTTRPATTAPPTTRRPRPTTTRAPTTTAPASTAATTTTTAPPAST
jgi:RNA polymerase sigma-70 factor (ECF subfamily)